MGQQSLSSEGKDGAHRFFFPRDFVKFPRGRVMTLICNTATRRGFIELQRHSHVGNFMSSSYEIDDDSDDGVGESLLDLTELG